MKIETPMINWHDQSPIFSVDIHPSGRIATAGQDGTIRIWKLEERNTITPGNVLFLSQLSGHNSAVNTIRFSPNGQLLASVSDDKSICIWQFQSFTYQKHDERKPRNIAYSIEDLDKDKIDNRTDIQNIENIENIENMNNIRSIQEYKSMIFNDIHSNPLLYISKQTIQDTIHQIQDNIKIQIQRREEERSVNRELGCNIDNSTHLHLATDTTTKENHLISEQINRNPIDAHIVSTQTTTTTTAPATTISISKPLASHTSLSSSQQSGHEETWKCIASLRAHFADIYSLSWSPTSDAIYTGSVDGMSILWTAKYPDIDIMPKKTYDMIFGTAEMTTATSTTISAKKATTAAIEPYNYYSTSEKYVISPYLIKNASISTDIDVNDENNTNMTDMADMTSAVDMTGKTNAADMATTTGMREEEEKKISSISAETIIDHPTDDISTTVKSTSPTVSISQTYYHSNHLLSLPYDLLSMTCQGEVISPLSLQQVHHQKRLENKAKREDRIKRKQQQAQAQAQAQSQQSQTTTLMKEKPIKIDDSNFIADDELEIMDDDDNNNESNGIIDIISTPSLFNMTDISEYNGFISSSGTMKSDDEDSDADDIDDDEDDDADDADVGNVDNHKTLAPSIFTLQQFQDLQQILPDALPSELMAIQSLSSGDNFENITNSNPQKIQDTSFLSDLLKVGTQSIEDVSITSHLSSSIQSTTSSLSTSTSSSTTSPSPSPSPSSSSSPPPPPAAVVSNLTTNFGSGFHITSANTGHSGNVQGVTWDPLGEYIATQSADRTVNIYDILKHTQIGQIKKKDERVIQLKYTIQSAIVDSATALPVSASVSGSISNTLSALNIEDVIDSQNMSSDASSTSATAIATATATATSTSTPPPTIVPYFCKETTATYFRRLTFSPDGMYLLCPSGQAVRPIVTPTSTSTSGSNLKGEKPSISITTLPCVHVFHRSNLSEPLLSIPTNNEQSIGIVFHKIPFQVENIGEIDVDVDVDVDKRDGVDILRYKYIFAIYTTKSIIIADTHTFQPFACIRDFHFTSLSDLSWLSTNLDMNITKLVKNSNGNVTEQVTDQATENDNDDNSENDIKNQIEYSNTIYSSLLSTLNSFSTNNKIGSCNNSNQNDIRDHISLIKHTDPIPSTPSISTHTSIPIAITPTPHSLVVTSQDGYCSFVHFEHGELGNELPWFYSQLLQIDISHKMEWIENQKIIKSTKRPWIRSFTSLAETYNWKKCIVETITQTLIRKYAYLLPNIITSQYPTQDLIQNHAQNPKGKSNQEIRKINFNLDLCLDDQITTHLSPATAKMYQGVYAFLYKNIYTYYQIYLRQVLTRTSMQYLLLLSHIERFYDILHGTPKTSKASKTTTTVMSQIQSKHPNISALCAVFDEISQKFTHNSLGVVTTNYHPYFFKTIQEHLQQSMKEMKDVKEVKEMKEMKEMRETKEIKTENKVILGKDDKVGQVDKANQTDQTDQTDQTVQTDQTNQTDHPNKTNKTNKTDKASKTINNISTQKEDMKDTRDSKDSKETIKPKRVRKLKQPVENNNSIITTETNTTTNAPTATLDPVLPSSSQDFEIPAIKKKSTPRKIKPTQTETITINQDVTDGQINKQTDLQIKLTKTPQRKTPKKKSEVTESIEIVTTEIAAEIATEVATYEDMTDMVDKSKITHNTSTTKTKATKPTTPRKPRAKQANKTVETGQDTQVTIDPSSLVLADSVLTPSLTPILINSEIPLSAKNSDLVGTISAIDNADRSVIVPTTIAQSSSTNNFEVRKRTNTDILDNTMVFESLESQKSSIQPKIAKKTDKNTDVKVTALAFSMAPITGSTTTTTTSSTTRPMSLPLPLSLPIQMNVSEAASSTTANTTITSTPSKIMKTTPKSTPSKSTGGSMLITNFFRTIKPPMSDGTDVNNENNNI